MGDLSKTLTAGCQDIVFHLRHGKKAPDVSGAILQAPVSDRHYLDTQDNTAERLERAKTLLVREPSPHRCGSCASPGADEAPRAPQASGKPEELLPYKGRRAGHMTVFCATCTSHLANASAGKRAAAGGNQGASVRPSAGGTHQSLRTGSTRWRPRAETTISSPRISRCAGERRLFLCCSQSRRRGSTCFLAPGSNASLSES